MELAVSNSGSGVSALRSEPVPGAVDAVGMDDGVDVAPVDLPRDEVGPPEGIAGSSVAMSAYAATRPINGQIVGIMDGLRGVQAEQASLHEQQRVLHDLLAAINSHGKHKSDSKVNIAKPDGEDHGPLMIPDGRGGMESAVVMLEQVGLTAEAHAEDGVVTPRALEQLAESLGEKQTKLGEGNQLQTLALQELMHQRDLFIQLATNTLAAATHVDQQIVGNIR
jgi:hypothetical protein